MDVNILLKVKEYLKVTGIADIDGETTKMDLRKLKKKKMKKQSKKTIYWIGVNKKINK